MRIVLWGTCDTGKPRVRILLDGLRKNGVELIECRTDIWNGIQDKSQIKGTGRWLGMCARLIMAYPALIWRYMRLPPHDWVLLGYPAIPDIFLIRIFAWLRRAPIAMDWFLSAYDTIVLDRKLIGTRNPLAWALWGMEWLAVRLANCVFMDTRAHARRVERLFHLREGHCASVWVGVEDAVFTDTCSERPPREISRPIQVLFYGQFIPLHGIPTIIEAARLLRDEPIEWLIIGHGQESARIRVMLNADPLPLMRMLEWVDYETLSQHIRHADICLGIFGTSEKAASVIPNKVFQIVAMGCPLITRDSPAIREILDDTPPSVYLVPPANPAALAAVLLDFARHGHSATYCHEELRGRLGPESIGHKCLEILTSHSGLEP